MRKFDGFKNVDFGWFHGETPPGPPRPYADLIEGYDPTDRDGFHLAEEYIAELFTADEAATLKAYLDTHYGDAGTTTIAPAELPVARNVMATGLIPVGGLQDFWTGLTKGQLPFKPWAYFDLRHCELMEAPRPVI